MPASTTTLAPTIASRAELIDHIAAGCKPPADWRIGTEHEKFAFRLDDKRRLPYEGEASIRALLEGMQRFGWDPVREQGNTIALRLDRGSITLEPGGQVELSGAPLENIHQTCDEVHTHLAQVKEVAGEFGAGLLGMGFDPKWARADIPWMPKQRYDIMRGYMPKKGNLGIDMMLRSCTVQVNLDFESEADMIRKFRVGLALQPVVTALFANSPFTEGKPNGFMSFRSHVWTDTDPDRCGILPFVFDDSMGFERYADHALDVPMYFVYRDGVYLDASGQSFRDFLEGRLPALPGQKPTAADWEDHLTTLFPEVRMKRFLELRGADGGPWGRICALPAIWVGLLYDRTALDTAYDMIQDWTAAENEMLREEVPRQALGTPFRGAPLHKLAREVVALARAGLERRARRGATSADESEYLDPLTEILESGLSPANVLLDAYRGRWGESVDPVFEEYAY